jgi:glutaminyl-peptide cyclotransferase
MMALGKAAIRRRPPRRLRDSVTVLYLNMLLVVLCITASLAIVTAKRPDSLPRLTSRDYARLDNLGPFYALKDPAATLDHRRTDSLLSKILIPRIPASKGNLQVQRILTEPFEGPNSRWNITRHAFTASTPKGKVEMTNIIVSRHPNALRQLVLAAHHDSLSTISGFIGATDSAVPCALLVDTALALESMMEDAKGSERWDETGLQLIFFDGEEAYKAWSSTDSTYGSRALATQWAKQFHTQSSIQPRRHVPGLSTMRKIDTIEHFVLLDLLGTPHPRIPRYYPDTGWIHDEMRSVEERLAEAGHLFPKEPDGGYELPPRSRSDLTEVLPMPSGIKEVQHSFFANDHRTMFGIEDDHLPFLANGVPICHLIPTPFPAVWHTKADDASAIDYPTVHAWAMIMRVFVAEYLGLQPQRTPVTSKRNHQDLVSGANLAGRHIY